MFVTAVTTHAKSVFEALARRAPRSGCHYRLSIFPVALAQHALVTTDKLELLAGRAVPDLVQSLERGCVQTVTGPAVLLKH